VPLRLVTAWDQIPEWFKFQGARRWLAAAEQPPASLVLEPACPEMAGDTPWGLTSRSTTSEPGEESWDFNESVPTLARNRTR
jgi:hypothetical protein